MVVKAKAKRMKWRTVKAIQPLVTVKSPIFARFASAWSGAQEFKK